MWRSSSAAQKPTTSSLCAAANMLPKTTATPTQGPLQQKEVFWCFARPRISLDGLYIVAKYGPGRPPPSLAITHAFAAIHTRAAASAGVVMASVPGASVEGDPRSISLQRPFGVRSSSHRTGRSRSSHANTGFGLAAEQEREAIRDAIRGRSSITEEDLPRWEPHEATLAPKWYKFRWWVLNPCQVRHWPAACTPRSLLTCELSLRLYYQRRVCKCWRWTIGEFFVVLMVLGGLVGAFKITGISEDNTGSIATIPLALTFGTVNHNSIWTFLLGIPFERALSYHKMFAYLSVLSGLWHGYNAYLKYHVRHLLRSAMCAALVTMSFAEIPVHKWGLSDRHHPHWLYGGDDPHLLRANTPTSVRVVLLPVRCGGWQCAFGARHSLMHRVH